MEELRKEHVADFKAVDSTFIDSWVEKDFNEWMNRIYKKNLQKQKPEKAKLKRRTR